MYACTCTARLCNADVFFLRGRFEEEVGAAGSPLRDVLRESKANPDQDVAVRVHNFEVTSKDLDICVERVKAFSSPSSSAPSMDTTEGTFLGPALAEGFAAPPP